MLIRFLKASILFLIIFHLNLIYAQDGITKRVPEFSNHKVNVWKTIIYPTSKEKLNMHRHNYNRVVVALSNGLLKITSNKGHVHYLKLKKGRSYYLQKDPLNELHTDENLSNHPVSVVVVELKF